MRQTRRDDGLVYVLHTASRPDQFVVRSRDEAIAQATSIAARQQRRAWFTADGHEFTPIDGRPDGLSRGERPSNNRTQRP